MFGSTATRERPLKSKWRHGRGLQHEGQLSKASVAVGQRVRFKVDAPMSPIITATIGYVGHVLFSDGIWVGLDLDQASAFYSKNDGSIQGVRYWEAREYGGLFVRECVVKDRVVKDDDDGSKRDRGKCPLPPSSMALIRARWAAASYTRAGQDWKSLFDRHDTDGSGEMDMGEMKSLFRRVMRIPPRDVSDNDIDRFFRFIDVGEWSNGQMIMCPARPAHAYVRACVCARRF